MICQLKLSYIPDRDDTNQLIVFYYWEVTETACGHKLETVIKTLEKGSDPFSKSTY